jgi:putative membrane protein (TIGR04086 family)
VATEATTRRVRVPDVSDETMEFRAVRPTVVRWGAVLSGTAIGLALLGLLTALWVSLAYGSEVDAVRDNLGWFVGASAVVSLFAGAWLAGYYAGVRGWGPGMANGLTMWGVLFVLSFGIGVPSIFNLLNLGRQVSAGNSLGLLQPGVDQALWATFWSLLIGAIAAAIGGAAGGSMVRPAGYYRPGDVDPYDDRHDRDRDDDFDRHDGRVVRRPDA